MKTKKMFGKIPYLMTVFALAMYVFIPNYTLAADIVSCGFPGTCSVDVTGQADQVMQEMESRYGFNQDILRNMKTKEYAPRVEIFFDNSNPKPGEKVTASAVAEYFKNDTQNLYYNWYIIHTKDGKPQTATNSIRDGKIEAQRILAAGDYDPNLDGQNYANPDSDPDHDGWPPIDKNSFTSDTSSAPFGGSDGTGKQCFRHNFGTNDPASTEDSSGTDKSITCDHEWASQSGEKSGTGKFPTGQEEYWKTNPNDPDTDGDSFPDGADVIGLGQETFTWNYQPGDRVGVVVEGMSIIPIDQTNAYFKIMWGFPDTCDSSKVGLIDSDECDGSSDFGYGFLATRAPNEEQTGDKLKTSLSFTPDNPVADPSDENKENISADGTIADADQISLTSSIDSSNNDPQNLYYTWQISKSTDLSGENWTEIKDIQSNINTKTATSGLGLSSFTFSPKKKILDEEKDNIVYFKVTLTVGTASNVATNRGRTSVIIPVNKNGIKLSLYKVNIDSGKAAPGAEVCSSGLYKMLCPAVQNQMLAAKVTSKKYDLTSAQFSWTLDGESYAPPANASQYFSGLDNRTVIFPIAAGEQETEDISVTATPKDALAPVTGSRSLTIVRPAVFIRSADENTSWQQITAVASTERKNAYENIISEDSMDALGGSKPSYHLDFVPDYLFQDDQNVQIDWQLNGTSIHDAAFYDTNPLNGGSAALTDNDNTFSFPTDSSEGAYYALSANAKKFWSDDEKKILSAVWNINPLSLDADASVSISTVVARPADVTAQAAPTQMLAAVGTHLPEYLMYNLRLVLTIFVMFFVSSGFYALSRKIRFGD